MDDRRGVRPDGGLRIAVDIGGTFTDCVVLDERGGRLTTKALTTPDDPAEGVVHCVETAAREIGTDVREILRRTVAFVHGTTIAPTPSSSAAARGRGCS